MYNRKLDVQNRKIASIGNIFARLEVKFNDSQYWIRKTDSEKEICPETVKKYGGLI